MSRMNVVDSPPGMINPSRPSSCPGLRTSTASTPRRRSTAACSRKFPCTARTPILIEPILDSAHEPIRERPLGDLGEPRLELCAVGDQELDDGDVVPARQLPV